MFLSFVYWLTSLWPLRARFCWPHNNTVLTIVSNTARFRIFLSCSRLHLPVYFPYLSWTFHSWCSCPCGIHNLNQAFSSRMYHQNYVSYLLSSSNNVHRTFQLLFSSYEMVLKQVDHAYWVLHKKAHSVSKRHHHMKLSKQVRGTLIATVIEKIYLFFQNLFVEICNQFMDSVIFLKHHIVLHLTVLYSRN